MALGSTQPLTEMSNRDISLGVGGGGGEGGRCVGLTTYHLHVLIVWKSGSRNLVQPQRPFQACNGTALHLP
jgi:hypothetical protein